MLVSKQKNGGFTLIELLVVIGIVALLSTLAVGGYGAYRKAALVDLAVDDIISKAYQMRDRALHGESEEKVSKCFGFSFDFGGGKYDVKEFEEDFMGKKQWADGAWRYISCDKSSRVEKDLEIDEMINVVRVAGIVGDFDIRYVPPFGEMRLLTSEQVVPEKVLFTVVYGDSVQAQYSQKFELNTKTEQFNKNVEQD
ncbi:prepilin-type N-terminal cleavage/methylation domain-containing protein [Patescibacteria group bacterium]|nr:prepilin-type N-terminal cleavage/methylation domain-containing protein [Patescibacteria group bacterium]